ncbi:zinc finger CCHC domain-containing protein 9-like [Lingula anatina]|uniref:Zinc finger CCHC domain-containing protein 9-like n=1 Tax=Lingula anatina TaxID=7574 RepID=A0A1S3JYJ2_LINAN|nr:zinc finger CCHC domain-containing protein 9-like [Lingula anatina]|eukprot:XP_013415139.1 zinc finger CCHC domain-containing protein 9-like [Lingula anatina]
MTRWARGGPANKKKELSASSWTEMKTGEQKPKPANTNSEKDHTHSKLEKHGQTQSNQHKGPQKGGVAKHKKKFGKKAFIKGKFNVANSQDYKAARSEYRRVKRINEREAARVCFNCRQSGHTLADCPQVTRDTDQGTGICFKCGSTEHSSATCKAKVEPGHFPYAKCFICAEMGHISKQCPDNPRGLYPKGGCCRMCGSVEHFRKDCPELQKQQGIADTTIDKVHKYANVEDEPTLHESPKLKKKKKGPKVVTF